MKYLTSQKLARAIDHYLCNDLLEDVEYALHIRKRPISQKEAKAMSDMLLKLYRICHVAGKPSCRHPGWAEELHTFITSMSND